MNYYEIKKRYEILKEKALHESHSDSVKTMLNRGLVCCNNDALIGARPILLMGVNPSYDKEEPKDFVFIETKDPDSRHPFWTNKKNQFGSLVSEMAYMDLFPLRASKQNVDFESVLKEENKLRAEFLAITQDAIEDLRPRLVVHANRASRYYWGFNKKYPWMGYKFRPLSMNEVRDLDFISEERLRLFPIYVFDGGFIDSCKRINNERYQSTALKGSVFVDYVMKENRRLEKLMYNAEEWQRIWSWVNRHV